MADGERQRGNDKGVTGQTVAENVRSVRTARDLTQAQLSSRLAELGRPIPVAAVGKLETGIRTIDVDDLLALALALNVSPLRLLLPDTRRPGDPVEVTGSSGTARAIWEWGIGDMPLEGVATARADFQSRSLPWWLEVETVVASTQRKHDSSTPAELLEYEYQRRLREQGADG